MELFLARIFGGLSDEEKKVYASLRTLEGVLNDHTSREELLGCRTRRLPEIYRVYASIEGNKRKPYLHKWFYEIVARFDECIKALG